MIYNFFKKYIEIKVETFTKKHLGKLIFVHFFNITQLVLIVYNSFKLF